MENNKTHRSEQSAGRISILFFWTLLMGVLLWAERTAWGHYNLIFRGMLPWLMPTIAGVFILALIALIILWSKGFARTDKLFSTPFLLYLVAAPIPAMILPWLTTFSKTLQFFSIMVDVLFVGLVGYFISYLLHDKISLAAGRLTAFITCNAIALSGYHQLYLSTKNSFLKIENYLSSLQTALILIGALVVILITLLIVDKKKEPKLKLSALLPPILFTALLLFGASLLHQQIPYALRQWLALGGIALEVIWLIVQAILMKLKKK